MELEQQVEEFAGRFDAGHSPYVGYDETQEWPDGRLDELIEKGVLIETASSKTVICKKCQHECTIEPSIETLPQTDKTVGLHLCDVQGMIEIDLDRLKQWEIVPERLPVKPKNIKKPKKKRATKKDIENRNRTIVMAAAEIQRDHDRLPTVDEIIQKTHLERQQIYDSAPYNDGKIAKASSKTTDELTGTSVQKSEFYGQKSEEHGRRNKRTRSDQAELDALIDQQTDDDRSNYVKI